MTYKVVSLDAFYLSGIRKEFSTETMGEIKPLWDALEDDGTLIDLHRFNDVEILNGYIGACLKSEPSPNLNYLISVASHSPIEHYESISIPASLWVVFEAVGPIPTAIQETFEYIYGTWFKDAPFIPLQTADLEFYPLGMEFETDNPKVEIWIPVERK
ncbi:GyrI-like domain-containing protein [Macrococcoides caseolyticum]|uniref:GyrI-like domain-containing protein n=1 Tax=Macrococcoides caseolyticum TaxID=69966 RepID=UPI001F1A618D|nr:GyrI-like domain-containing protein [Macrococcus caseolyticus]MCE4956441.1 GyrI-like domain-containing protein [Macrococcus caseolyticus]